MKPSYLSTILRETLRGKKKGLIWKWRKWIRCLRKTRLWERNWLSSRANLTLNNSKRSWISTRRKKNCLWGLFSLRKNSRTALKIPWLAQCAKTLSLNQLWWYPVATSSVVTALKAEMKRKKNVHNAIKESLTRLSQLFWMSYWEIIKKREAWLRKYSNMNYLETKNSEKIIYQYKLIIFIS